MCIWRSDFQPLQSWPYNEDNSATEGLGIYLVFRCCVHSGHRQILLSTSASLPAGRAVEWSTSKVESFQPFQSELNNERSSRTNQTDSMRGTNKAILLHNAFGYDCIVVMATGVLMFCRQVKL